MTCKHLRKLYQLCQEHDLKIASSDIVRITCKECEEVEVCPSTLMDEYDARREEEEEEHTKQVEGRQ